MRFSEVDRAILDSEIASGKNFLRAVVRGGFGQLDRRVLPAFSDGGKPTREERRGARATSHWLSYSRAKAMQESANVPLIVSGT